MSDRVPAKAPRMTGRVRRTALPLLRDVPDPAGFVEHRTADGRRVFIANRVLDDLARLERADHPIETGCLLFGGFFSAGEQTCAIVTKLIFPKDGEVIGTKSTVTITAEGAERMIARAWQEDPLLKPLGWGHTHPLFEAYFSQVDCEEQRIWTEPASVGIVISGLEDPMARYRVFVGPESQPAELVRPVEGSAARSEESIEIAANGNGDRPRIRPTRARRPLGRSRGETQRIYALAIALSIAILLLVSLLTWMSAADAAHQTHATRRAVERIERNVAADLAAAGRAGGTHR